MGMKWQTGMVENAEVMDVQRIISFSKEFECPVPKIKLDINETHRLACLVSADIRRRMTRQMTDDLDRLITLLSIQESKKRKPRCEMGGDIHQSDQE